MVKKSLLKWVLNADCTFYSQGDLLKWLYALSLSGSYLFKR